MRNEMIALSKKTLRQMQSYGIAIGSVFLSCGLVRLLFPIAGVPLFGAFYLAAVASAWTGGLRAAFVANILSSLAMVYFFVNPIYHLGIGDFAHQIRLGFPLVVLVGVSSLTAAMQEKKSKLERNESQLQHERSQLAQSNESLARHAQGYALALAAARVQDDLTGLPNQTFFLRQLDRTLNDYRHESETLFAVLLLDLDRFRTVNDGLGHAVGDHLLIEVSTRLQKDQSLGTIVARLGGGTFGILLKTVHNTQEALQFAARTQLLFNIPFQLAGTEVTTSATIGVVMADPCYESPRELLQNAEIALFEAKRVGQGRCKLFDLQLYEQVTVKLQQEQALRQALIQKQLRVVYQPIVNLATQQVEGFETLVRWQHPQRGRMLPAEFLPTAEEIGLLGNIDQWVLSTACQELAGLHRLQRQPNPRLSISVNVSRAFFAQANFVSVVGAILEQTQLPPGCLKLELTEEIIVEDIDQALAKLNVLRALGVQLNIDDFGTGYSSLSRLHQLPIHAIKIDRSFVAQLGKNLGSLEIIRAIVTLAQALNLEVTAEGIEEEHQYQQLLTLGCQTGQGYLFATPLEPFQVQQLAASYWMR
jgi:diguanylate cyclase (GGDEF)-like protein